MRVSVESCICFKLVGFHVCIRSNKLIRSGLTVCQHTNFSTSIYSHSVDAKRMLENCEAQILLENVKDIQEFLRLISVSEHLFVFFGTIRMCH